MLVQGKEGQAEPAKDAKKTHYDSTPPTPKETLFLRTLPKEFTEKALRAKMEEFGEVKNAKLLMHTKSNVFKGALPQIHTWA